MQDVLVYWGIFTFDRSKENPLPVQMRHWVLKWNLVSEGEAEEIRKILDIEIPNGQTQDDIRIGEEEYSFSFHRPDLRMLDFRDRFELIEQLELEHLMATHGPIIQFVPVKLGIEYFEDEQMRPVSKLQMLREATGQKHPLIPYDPQSILQLGPAPRSSREGSEDDSNKIARFLEQVDYVANSSWWKHPPSIKTRRGDIADLIHAIFPKADETQAALLSLRQLYAKDNLFNIACNRHTKLCGDERKVQWIQEVKKAFNEFLDSPVGVPAPLDVTARELLDMFLYGSGIAHSNGTEKAETNLRHLLDTRGKSHVVMAIHCSLRFIFEHAIRAFLVIRQDFQHWLQSCLISQPSGVSMHDVLSDVVREEKSLGRTNEDRLANWHGLTP